MIFLCVYIVQFAFPLGQNPPNAIPIALWPAGQVPLSLGEDPEKDIPTITPYWPDSSRFPYPCAAFVIAPQGAYEFIESPNANVDYALFLNEFGIAGFTLTYRVEPNGYHYPAQHLDVERAIRMVRYHGKEGDWDVDPNRVGIIGSSAGGHLAAIALTRFSLGSATLDALEHVSSRPDLGALAYAAITPSPKADWEDANMIKNLLGPNDTPEMRDYISNDKHVSSMTPPTFIFHNMDDGTVPVENSILFDEALAKAGVVHETHLYPTGGHGIGLGLGWGHPYDPRIDSMDDMHAWTAELAKFLVARGWAA